MFISIFAFQFFVLATFLLCLFELYMIDRALLFIYLFFSYCVMFIICYCSFELFSLCFFNPFNVFVVMILFHMTFRLSYNDFISYISCLLLWYYLFELLSNFYAFSTLPILLFKPSYYASILFYGVLLGLQLIFLFFFLFFFYFFKRVLIIVLNIMKAIF